MTTRIKPRSIVTASIYGKSCQCRVIVDRGFSMDVERLPDGRCFRLSGLRVQERQQVANPEATSSDGGPDTEDLKPEFCRDSH